MFSYKNLAVVSNDIRTKSKFLYFVCLFVLTKTLKSPKPPPLTASPLFGTLDMSFLTTGLS